MDMKAKRETKKNAGKKYETELAVCREILQNLGSLSGLLIIAERDDLNEKCDQAWELMKEIRSKLKGL